MNEMQGKMAWFCVTDPRLVTMMAIAAIQNGGLENIRGTIDEEGDGIFAPEELDLGAQMLTNAGLLVSNGGPNAYLSRLGGAVVMTGWRSWWQHTLNGTAQC